MDGIQTIKDEAYCEEVPLSRLAREVGTPVYVYSKRALTRRCQDYLQAFKGHPTSFCYAIKANSNLTVLRQIFASGFGADVVSVGELERALLAGVAPAKIVFSGVGKQVPEIERALDVGIRSFQVESADELALLHEIGRRRKQPVPISLRLNPNIDAHTDPHITTGLYSTKFGIPEEELTRILALIAEPVRLIGLSCHLGSQITELAPFRQAAERLVQTAQRLPAEHRLQYLDLGGGLGIRYHEEEIPALEDYARTIFAAVRPSGLPLLLEPGRSLVGNAGLLLTTVVTVKQTPERHFAVVDAAMNDLIRPSLYGSYHAIHTVRVFKTPRQLTDVVGPVCESGDFLGKDRELPPLARGDLLWVASCGAYAASMASNYNARPRAPEVLVDGDKFRVIRQRETLARLWEEEL